MAKNYEVKTVGDFEKELKGIYKKYPSVKMDIAALKAELENNPFIGGRFMISRTKKIYLKLR